MSAFGPDASTSTTLPVQALCGLWRYCKWSFMTLKNNYRKICTYLFDHQSHRAEQYLRFLKEHTIKKRGTRISDRATFSSANLNAQSATNKLIYAWSAIARPHQQPAARAHADSFIYCCTLDCGFCTQGHKLIKASIRAVDIGKARCRPVTCTDNVDSASHELGRKRRRQACTTDSCGGSTTPRGCAHQLRLLCFCVWVIW